MKTTSKPTTNNNKFQNGFIENQLVIASGNGDLKMFVQKINKNQQRIW